MVSICLALGVGKSAEDVTRSAAFLMVITKKRKIVGVAESESAAVARESFKVS